MTEPARCTATEWRDLIRDGEISAREAVTWHIDRMTSVHRSLNAVVVPLFEQALAAAADADALRARGLELPPLHGLPVTVKECFDVEGVRSTGGVTTSTPTAAASDSAIVAALRAAGAIVLGKTNMSQLSWYTEADNPLFGRTSNPWNLDRSTGGSSGGEAAIIVAGGSPLGFGTDSGGSVRIPAHCCGAHSLKPTSGRLPAGGTVDDRLFAGTEARFLNQPGPIARSVADLRMALGVLGGVPSAGAAGGIAGLRVGIEPNGPLPSAPAVERAVIEAGASLAELGAHVEPFVTPDIAHGLRLFRAVFAADGGARLRAALGASPRDERVMHALGRMGRARSLESYWQLVDGCASYRGRFDAAFERAGVDVLLCPAFALPAVPHGASTEVRRGQAFAALHNLLGRPAGVVSLTRVRAGEEQRPARAGDVVGRAAAAVEVGSAGLPVGVQVVGAPWAEARVLSVMEALERGFREHADFPVTPHLPDDARRTDARAA